MLGVRLGRPHTLRSVTLRAATASLPLLVALLLTGGQARADESPPTKREGQAPVPSLAQAGADPFAAPADVAPAPSGTPEAPAPGATPTSPAVPAPGATPSAPAASDDRPGKPTLGPAPTPAASAEPRVLISEVVIEGLADHPESERLELATYAAMAVTPGNAITRSELETDLQAIYATGWFSDVRIQPQDGPLGVRLVVSVVPNPVLTKVSLDPTDAKLPETVLQDTFAGDYGKTLNLVTLQGRMQELQKWYADQGFSLARVTGPSRVGPDGNVQLLVRQGTVKGVEVQFLNKEGSATNDKGQPIKGKTKEWVITREISIKTGEVFNRRNLEDDLKRLYGTGLFSDVKVTLRPEPEDPGSVVIVLGVVEQSTGSLSGGLGYSQSQGVFGQIQVQDSNLFGRAWDLSTSFTYGQFGGLADISFSDPWIKGDRFRTAFRVKAFISRDAPQVFQSQDNGNIFTVSDFYRAPGTQVAYNIFSPFNPLLDVFPSVTAARIASEVSGQNLSWFQFDGNSVLIQRVGANVQFVRPLNGGNPFKRAPWTVLLGLTGQVATPMDFSGTSRRFGLATPNESTALFTVPTSSVICLAYNCAASNQLLGLRLAATMSTLNDPRNPTSGNFISLGTEQFFSVGPDSPTFNRLRGSFTHFIPVRWLKFYKGCRPKAGETEDCKQALAFQMSAGTVVGDLPPYEAFCLGGGNSVRGYFDCDLGVGRSFGEATIEYRFPLFSIVSGELFIDGGTTFGSQTRVPGNLGGLLNKPGSGFSIGTGLIVTTPVGPLRLEVASQDFTGEWRFNLGVGWKF
ncbi:MULTISPECIES: BamA/TamA family outer membrane protein [unclassified Cyanobium]|uniref:BamA/TamA family outer membrane protein n=1 Tax=unclassified Cyanobium TaxID=2627006 RepID=UPI0020CC366E|nr:MULTISPECIES: BamA/TamA family outer membrane protein [unclassified Cyanobium]MCP9859905.1 BamA/TamA family outer membrane protein [Cyanobium sp. Cruz-8H5]MCP9866997.1 BamA/TamA family outer membrane protein [Cyanobium sp. Cruz-8D1]